MSSTSEQASRRDPRYGACPASDYDDGWMALAGWLLLGGLWSFFTGLGVVA